jgi:hypothetical protein
MKSTGTGHNPLLEFLRSLDHNPMRENHISSLDLSSKLELKPRGIYFS